MNAEQIAHELVELRGLIQTNIGDTAAVRDDLAKLKKALATTKRKRWWKR